MASESRPSYSESRLVSVAGSGHGWAVPGGSWGAASPCASDAARALASGQWWCVNTHPVTCRASDCVVRVGSSHLVSQKGTSVWGTP